MSRVPRAVLLDALGTLVELVDPWGALVRELAERGAPVSVAEARRAMLAEMAYYRAHHDEAADEPALEALRDRCASVLQAELPPPARELDGASVRAAMLAALRFRAFPEVPAALDGLHAAGARLVVVSNWDVSLHGVLRATGLAGRLDAVLTSAQAGVAKPAPAIFERALELAGGVAAANAVHVGDSVEADVAGALAAGIEPVLVVRAGSAAAPEGVRIVRSLSELLPAPR